MHVGSSAQSASGTPVAAPRWCWQKSAARAPSAASTCSSPSSCRSTIPSPEAQTQPPFRGGTAADGPTSRSRHDALANYASKAPFDALRPDVLAAYVDNGFAPDPDGGIRAALCPGERGRHLRLEPLAWRLRHLGHDRLPGHLGVRRAHRRHRARLPGAASPNGYTSRRRWSWTGSTISGPFKTPTVWPDSVDDALQAI